MKMQKTRPTRIAVIISLVIHVIAFLTLAWVKLYTDENVKESGISVTFVQELETKAMRRSLQARPALMSKPLQRHPSGQQVAASLSHRASSDFYIIDASAEVFSDGGALDHIVIQGAGMQCPYANFRQSMVKPITTELRKSSPQPPQAQMGSSVHNLFAELRIPI